MAALIEDYRAKYLTEKSGRVDGAPPLWLKRTAHLDADALARSVLETIVSRTALGKPMPQPALAAAIGQSVVLLHVIGIWETRNPALLKAYHERLQKAGTTRDHRHTVLRHGFAAKVLGSEGLAHGRLAELMTMKAGLVIRSCVLSRQYTEASDT